MRDGTVKQFIEALDEMRKIYPFNDEETRICTIRMESLSHDGVQIITRDKNTGVDIMMSKSFGAEY